MADFALAMMSKLDTISKNSLNNFQLRVGEYTRTHKSTHTHTVRVTAVSDTVKQPPKARGHQVSHEDVLGLKQDVIRLNIYCPKSRDERVHYGTSSFHRNFEKIKNYTFTLCMHYYQLPLLRVLPASDISLESVNGLNKVFWWFSLSCRFPDLQLNRLRRWHGRFLSWCSCWFHETPCWFWPEVDLLWFDLSLALT